MELCRLQCFLGLRREGPGTGNVRRYNVDKKALFVCVQVGSLDFLDAKASGSLFLRPIANMSLKQ